jgi:hypothetical protein
MIPGGSTTDTKGAVTAALLRRKKGQGLASAILENVKSGEYTTETKPEVVPGKAPKYANAPAAKGSSEGGGQINELFWNGPGAKNIKNGKRQKKGFVSGHTDHVHLAADRATMKRAAALAKSMGLNVGGYGKGVTSGHVANSNHYKPYGAMDVSGERMAEFARRIASGDF